jgi:hypothetical protein
MVPPRVALPQIAAAHVDHVLAGGGRERRAVGHAARPEGRVAAHDERPALDSRPAGVRVREERRRRRPHLRRRVEGHSGTVSAYCTSLASLGSVGQVPTGVQLRVPPVHLRGVRDRAFV